MAVLSPITHSPLRSPHSQPPVAIHDSLPGNPLHAILFAPNVTPITFNDPPTSPSTPPKAILFPPCPASPTGASSCDSPSPSPSPCVTTPTNTSATPSADSTTGTSPPRPHKPPHTHHGARKPSGHIPRPPNAFILFRSSFIRNQHVSTAVETNHSTLSKIIGLTWQHLPHEERQVWHAKARAALDEHKRRYPQYAFRPLHSRAAGANAASGGANSPTCKRSSGNGASGNTGAMTTSTTTTSTTTSTTTKPEKRKVREVGPKDLKRCAKIAELLVVGIKGAALDAAVREFDATHVPEIITRFEAPLTARMYRRGSSAPVPDAREENEREREREREREEERRCKRRKKARASSSQPTRKSAVSAVPTVLPAVSVATPTPTLTPARRLTFARRASPPPALKLEAFSIPPSPTATAFAPTPMSATMPPADPAAYTFPLDEALSQELHAFSFAQPSSRSSMGGSSSSSSSCSSASSVSSPSPPPPLTPTTTGFEMFAPYPTHHHLHLQHQLQHLQQHPHQLQHHHHQQHQQHRQHQHQQHHQQQHLPHPLSIDTSLALPLLDNHSNASHAHWTAAMCSPLSAPATPDCYSATASLHSPIDPLFSAAAAGFSSPFDGFEMHQQQMYAMDAMDVHPLSPLPPLAAEDVSHAHQQQQQLGYAPYAAVAKETAGYYAAPHSQPQSQPSSYMAPMDMAFTAFMASVSEGLPYAL